MYTSKSLSLKFKAFLSCCSVAVLIACGGSEEETLESPPDRYEEYQEIPAEENAVDKAVEEKPTKKTTEETALPDETTVEEILDAIESGEDLDELLPATGAGTPAMPDYKVNLSVDDSIALGDSGRLMVWIGAETAAYSAPEGTVSDSTTLPSDAGEYAQVTPYGTGFKVSPKTQKCVRIHPSGSEVPFTLIPTTKGEIIVNAKIELHQMYDCSDSPVPKTAADLKVTVFVDKDKAFQEKKKELVDILWEKFKEFWGALLVLFFGLVLFLLRKKLKQWFGYEAEG